MDIVTVILLAVLLFFLGALVWAVIGSLPKKKKNKPWGGYYGYQMAGRRFDSQTSKPNITYLRGWLVNIFGWTSIEADDLLEGWSRDGVLSEDKLGRTGVELRSKDGKEIYHFRKVSSRTWEVVMMMDKPVMKD